MLLFSGFSFSLFTSTFTLYVIRSNARTKPHQTKESSPKNVIGGNSREDTYTDTQTHKTNK